MKLFGIKSVEMGELLTLDVSYEESGCDCCSGSLVYELDTCNSIPYVGTEKEIDEVLQSGGHGFEQSPKLVYKGAVEKVRSISVKEGTNIEGVSNV